MIFSVSLLIMQTQRLQEHNKENKWKPQIPREKFQINVDFLKGKSVLTATLIFYMTIYHAEIKAIPRKLSEQFLNCGPSAKFPLNLS